jgi:LmbE family N-acetylglucosaminyl deacetylase
MEITTNQTGDSHGIGKLTILVIAPHTDDAELGAGASINRWRLEGHRITIVNLSDTRNINGSTVGQRLRDEATKASAALGVERDDVIFGDFSTRHFSEERQRILDFLIELRLKLKPDIVIGPSISDTHQDHSVVAKEIQRAFKVTTVLGFDTYWNISERKFPVVVEVSNLDISSKVRSLSAYESQSGKLYMKEKNIMGQAAMRGLPRGFDYAEAFSVEQISMNLDARIGTLSDHE